MYMHLRAFRVVPMLIFLSVGFLSCDSNSKTSEVVVGAIFPLSGNASEQGNWGKQGIEIALKEINSDPNSQKIKVIYEDSRGVDQQVAVSAYQFLRQIHSVPAVISYGSPVGMVLSPRTNKDKVIQIGVATSTPLYSSDNDYTFRTYPDAGIETDVLVAEIKKSSENPAVGLVYVLNDYGEGMKKSLNDSLEKVGLKIEKEENFLPKETDFKTQLSKLKSANVNSVVIFSFLNEGALIIKQAHELGMGAQIFAGSAMFGGGDFIGMTRGTAEGVVISGVEVPDSSGYGEKFRAMFPDSYSLPAVSMSAFSYDALMAYSKALNYCKTPDSDCIRNYLVTNKDYSGSLGKWNFDSRGDVSIKFSLFRVEGGEFKVLDS